MKKILILLLSVSIMLGLAACGSADNASSVDPNAKELKIAASAKTFKFDQDVYHVKQGEPVTITLVNENGTHGIYIKGLGVALKGGKLSKTITPDKAGEFEIACSVECGAGHRQMKSKLIVE